MKELTKHHAVEVEDEEEEEITSTNLEKVEDEVAHEDDVHVHQDLVVHLVDTVEVIADQAVAVLQEDDIED